MLENMLFNVYFFQPKYLFYSFLYWNAHKFLRGRFKVAVSWEFLYFYVWEKKKIVFDRYLKIVRKIRISALLYIAVRYRIKSYLKISRHCLFKILTCWYSLCFSFIILYICPQDSCTMFDKFALITPYGAFASLLLMLCNNYFKLFY